MVKIKRKKNKKMKEKIREELEKLAWEFWNNNFYSATLSG